MALSIIKTDSRGAYRMIAEHDLYLDESGQKVIVVKQGEEVPKEAATVLTGKGGTIPTRYADLLKSLDTEVKEEVKVEPEVKPPTPEPEVKAKSKTEPAKPKSVEEKPAQ
jgi:hypothetical protein